MKDSYFEQQLETLKPNVWRYIQEYIPDKDPIEHYVMVKEYPRRQGKYFRPGLVLLSTQMHGGDPDQAHLTAAAMQTSEDWILVHDDLEDQSDERRSEENEYRPTLHKIYGEGLAINAGDALHMIMWKMLGDNVRKMGDERGWKIYDKMCDMLLTTAEGQYHELSWIRDRRVQVTAEEYYNMIDLKAGYYTVIGPLQLGAMVAGVTDDAKLDSIREWGIPFGRGFQIWDDVMNLTEDSKVQGKEKGGDILEGKRTLILIHLLDNCTSVEKSFITTIFSKEREEKTLEEKNYVLDLMNKYGSIEYAKKIAKDYAEDAKTKFDANTADLPETKAKKIIRGGIDFVVNRHN